MQRDIPANSVCVSSMDGGVEKWKEIELSCNK